jgi:hypothetical protein
MKNIKPKNKVGNLVVKSEKKKHDKKQKMMKIDKANDNFFLFNN